MYLLIFVTGSNEKLNCSQNGNINLYLQEESEVPDDETINQMIARTEEEFELFQVE